VTVKKISCNQYYLTNAGSMHHLHVSTDCKMIKNMYKLYITKRNSLGMQLWNCNHLMVDILLRHQCNETALLKSNI